MERPRLTRRWLIGAVVVAFVAVGLGVAVWVRSDDARQTRLTAALALSPTAAVRFTWTDWSAVRSRVGMSEAEATDHPDQFLTKAFDADLSSTSVLGDSTATMNARLGVSPANLEWELYADGSAGAVLLMGLPDDVSTADLGATLRRIGYVEPADADGVWQAGAAGLNAIGTLTPELSNLTLDSQHHVLAASDSAAFLQGWRDSERGSGDTTAVARVAAAIGGAQSAAVYDGNYACQALAMTQADSADQAEGARLIAEAGKINPLDAFAMADEPGGRVQVTMAFENSAQARTNADTRATLAIGPAPGQGGSFSDRYKLLRTAADGDLVTMTLQPLPDTYVLSDLATGPLLFASC